VGEPWIVLQDILLIPAIG
jgi:hypothetical protein